jgi:hypothetical protein
VRFPFTSAALRGRARTASSVKKALVQVASPDCSLTASLVPRFQCPGASCPGNHRFASVRREHRPIRTCASGKSFVLTIASFPWLAKLEFTRWANLRAGIVKTTSKAAPEWPSVRGRSLYRPDRSAKTLRRIGQPLPIRLRTKRLRALPHSNPIQRIQVAKRA